MIVLILFLLAFPIYADAATYWVSKSGSNSNSCFASATEPTLATQSRLTIHFGLKCLGAGDDLHIKSGTYVEYLDTASGTYTADKIATNIPSGTSANRTLITAIDGKGTVIIQPADVGQTQNFWISNRHYVHFKNLILDGTNGPTWAASRGHGFYIGSNNCTDQTNFILEGIEARHAARTGMVIAGGNHHLKDIWTHDNGTTGQGSGSGLYLQGCNTLVEYLLSENNVSTGISGIDPAKPNSPGNELRYSIIRNNGEHGIVTRDTGFDTNGGIHNNIIYNNSQQTTATHAGIGLTSSGNNRIYNNTIYNSGGPCIERTFGSGHIVRNNICWANTNNVPNGFGGGDTVSNNLSVDPSFVSAGTGNFALQAGSAAIGCGINVGLPFNGTLPDCGAHETFGYSNSATLNGNQMDITFGMNLPETVPILPASGMTGFSVHGGPLTGTDRTVTATRLTGTDSVVRLTFSGAACIAGETSWTFSYTPGTVTDNARIGGTNNQRLNAITSQPVSAANCTGGGPPPPTGGLHIAYELDDGTSGTTPITAQDSTANNLDGILTTGPTWTAGKHGSAVSFVNDVNDSIAVPYGNGVNLSTQSLTACMGVLPHTGMQASGLRRYFGTADGTNQRFYLSFINGTFGMGIQSSGSAIANVDFPFIDGVWYWVCLEADSTTDTATLIVNNIRGVGASSLKPYTSYALASNIALGESSGAISSQSPGATIDRFKLYTSVLTAQEHTDLYNAWEPVSPPSTGTFSQVAHQFYRVRTEKGNPSKLPNESPVSQPIFVVPNAAFGLTTQTDCTVADCESIGEKIYYTLNGGQETVVPDVCSGDAVCFYGNPPDAQVLAGPVTCCLVGGLTPTDGQTTSTAAAIPVFDLAQNASITNRRVLKLVGASQGSVYCFKERNQNGNVFTNYTPTNGACATVVPYGSAGF